MLTLEVMWKKKRERKRATSLDFPTQIIKKHDVAQFSHKKKKYYLAQFYLLGRRNRFTLRYRRGFVVASDLYVFFFLFFSLFFILSFFPITINITIRTIQIILFKIKILFMIIVITQMSRVVLNG